MIDVFEANRVKFGDDPSRPQCVYSARELTRWCRALLAAADGQQADGSRSGRTSLPPDAKLVRLWAHEGQRLFGDRLPRPEDQRWCAETIEATAAKRFPAEALRDDALKGPWLYSRWLGRAYAPARPRELRRFVASRLRTFYEEALDVPGRISLPDVAFGRSVVSES